MNRLSPALSAENQTAFLSSQSAVQSAGASSSVASAVFTAGDAVCCHSLFAPLHYEANYPYPLFVWLHAGRRDERQLARVMPRVSMRNYVAIAPRGTQAVDGDCDDHAAGFRWVQTPDHIYLAEQRVLECMALARRRYNVHPKRVFLAGVGSGGTMALRLALAHPDRFAGAASLGGGLPRGMAPLARLNEARNLPVLLSAGLASQRYPQDRVNDDLRLLHSATIAVQLRLYPYGDQIAPAMLGDLDRWVMQQICPAEDAGD